jgi:hypothetical protein
LLIDLSSSENGFDLKRFAQDNYYKTKKEAKMSGIATLLGWAGFITLVGMMIVYISRKWLR